MDILFEQNKKKPGDAGFQYDVWRDFNIGQKVDDGWDMDNDDF